jgi:hypothetical protein
MSLQAVWTIEISLLLTEGPQRRQSLGAFVCAASGPGARAMWPARKLRHIEYRRPSDASVHVCHYHRSAVFIQDCDNARHG